MVKAASGMAGAKGEPRTKRHLFPLPLSLDREREKGFSDDETASVSILHQVPQAHTRQARNIETAFRPGRVFGHAPGGHLLFFGLGLLLIPFRPGGEMSETERALDRIATVECSKYRARFSPDQCLSNQRRAYSWCPQDCTEKKNPQRPSTNQTGQTADQAEPGPITGHLAGEKEEDMASKVGTCVCCGRIKPITGLGLCGREYSWLTKARAENPDLDVQKWIEAQKAELEKKAADSAELLADDKASNDVGKSETDDPDTVMDDETAEMINPDTPAPAWDEHLDELGGDPEPSEQIEPAEVLILKFTGDDRKILEHWRKAAKSDRRTIEDEIITYLENAGERLSRLNRPYLSINDSLFRLRVSHDFGNHS